MSPSPKKEKSSSSDDEDENHKIVFHEILAQETGRRNSLNWALWPTSRKNSNARSDEDPPLFIVEDKNPVSA